MDLLVYEIEKGLARECFKKGQVSLGMEHYDKYINFIKSQLEINNDDEDLNERMDAVLTEYNKSLYKEAQKTFNNGKWAKTTEICQKMIQNKSQQFDIYKFMSLCYKNLHQNDIRLDFIKKYAELVPDDIENDKLLGEAYFECDGKKYAEIAIEHIEKYLKTNDTDANMWNLAGHIYATYIRKNVKQIETQLNYFLKARELDPKNINIIKNIAQTYTRARIPEKAKEYYELLISKYSKILTHDDWFSYAAFNLRFGNYKDGWFYYERRFNENKKSPEESGVYYPIIPKPKWDGEKDIKDSTLLVHYEQGLGDNMMFIRFVKQVQKYAKKVIAVVPDLVYPLFWESNLPFDIYPAKQELKELDFDYHISIMSLPYVLKTEPETIPDKDGYLSIDPERLKAYQSAFIHENGKFKLGINFEGGETGKAQGRDIEWERLKDFAEIENVQIYCLNKNITQEYLDKLLPSYNIIALGRSFKSFADTAAAILSMDYIVTTDSSILNLTGALGKEGLGLFNFDYEYRWYNAESGSLHWYSKIKSIVNEDQNEWDDTIKQAVTDVKNFMNKTHNK